MQCSPSKFITREIDILDSMASDSMGIAYIVITVNILGYFSVKRNRLGTLIYPCASVPPSNTDHRGGCLSIWAQTSNIAVWHHHNRLIPSCLHYIFSLLSTSSRICLSFLTMETWVFWKQVAASPLSPENSTMELVRCFSATRPLLGWVTEEKANCFPHFLCWWEVKGLLQVC